MGEILRRFNIATTINFPLIEFGAQDFETGATFVAADTQVSIDEGAFANTGSTPVHEGRGSYSLALTAAELNGERIVVNVIDQSGPKIWEDQEILIYTGPPIRALAEVYGTRSTIDDASPAVIEFDGALGLSTVTNYYNGQFLIFDQGTANPGLGRRINTYVGGITRKFAFREPWPVLPVNGDAFTIIGLQSNETAQAPRMV